MKANCYKYISSFILVGWVFVFNISAQLPVNTFFYYATSSSTTMYNYNTATNVSTVNTIPLPGTHIGLAVNNNFFAGPPMTFYTTVGGTFWYYNGSIWVNTGHTCSAINIGGAGPYIYTYNGGTGQIYRYNGTANAILILTLPVFGGPYDVTGDASGNFFVMRTSAAPYWLKQYSPAGVLMATYNLVGYPVGSAGGGFAFINGKLYADVSGTPVWGTITGTTITYGGPLTLSVAPGDLANWPLSIVPLPVELVNFDGNFNDDTRMNDLRWSTSSETNNEYFTIEFSSDGINWEWLTNVDGAGNSNELNSYSTYHDSPYHTTYYKLTQTDFDGHSKEYDPISIEKNLETDLAFNVYPNPAQHIITIESGKQYNEYIITDETGRVVYQINHPGALQTIDITHFESGLYFITGNFEEGVKTAKFIKN